LRDSQILLKSQPEGEPSADIFSLVESDLPATEEGQVLLATQYLSLDPYMRARLYEAKNYATNVNLHGKLLVRI